MVGSAAWGLWAYMNVDHLGVLDDPVVVEAADQACQKLRVEVDAASAPAKGTPADLVRSIRAQDKAIQGLVDQMDGLGQDSSGVADHSLSRGPAVPDHRAAAV